VWGKAILLLLVLAVLPVLATAAALTKLSRSESARALVAEFDCAVRYDDHSPRVQGAKIRVLVRTQESCSNNPSAVPVEFAVPADVAGLVQTVTFEARSETVSYLTIVFEENMLFTARPGDAQNSVEILTRPLSNQPLDPITAAENRQRVLPQPSDPKAGVSIEQQLSEARESLLDEDYDRGIRIYQRLLAIADTGHHPDALEYLSVAQQLRDRSSGKSRQAQAGYEAYLARFPQAPGAARVRQRLDALLATPAAAQSSVPASPQAGWRYFGSITQDFWSTTFDQDFAPDSQRRSALLTLVDAQADREGERFDLRARLNTGYQNDLSDTERSPENQALTSNVYLEVTDKLSDWRVRAGRQSLFTDGVLGRFDGIRGSYGLRSNLRLNITAGLPVDSPRFSGDTRRRFAAASLDFENLLANRFDQLSANLFVNRQTIDGISDRQAVGGEVRLRHNAWLANALVDYDTSYAVLNSALLHAALRVSNRLTMHGRVRAFAGPYLTTRNALIGQNVATIDELKALYTQGQIRTLARNRTSDGLSLALGFSSVLSQRWNFNADFSYLDIDGSIASGGVIAQPAQRQFFSAATFVGSSIFRNGDSTRVSVRLDSSNVADTTSVLLDFRLPLGASLRVAPNLTLSWRDASPVSDRQLLVEPGLRLLYRWRNRYRLELDTGYRLVDRRFNDASLMSALFPADSELSTELFFTLGWRVDF